MKHRFLAFISLALALALSFLLFSCGDSKDGNEKSSKNTGEVDEDTWNKYFKLDGVTNFELEYSSSHEESPSQGFDEHLNIQYKFNNGYYESESSQDGYEDGNHDPSHLLELPFYTSIQALPPESGLDFDFNDFEFNKKSKSYIFEDEFEVVDSDGIDSDGIAASVIRAEVVFVNGQLVKINYDASVTVEYTNSDMPSEKRAISEIYEFSNFKFSAGSSGDKENSRPEKFEKAVSKEEFRQAFELNGIDSFTITYHQDLMLTNIGYPDVYINEITEGTYMFNSGVSSEIYTTETTASHSGYEEEPETHTRYREDAYKDVIECIYGIRLYETTLALFIDESNYNTEDELFECFYNSFTYLESNGAYYAEAYEGEEGHTYEYKCYLYFGEDKLLEKIVIELLEREGKYSNVDVAEYTATLSFKDYNSTPIVVVPQN